MKDGSNIDTKPARTKGVKAATEMIEVGKDDLEKLNVVKNEAACEK